MSILLTAVVAVAAVTVGPAYYAAAQSSILQDTVGQATVNGRGFELNQSGPVNAIAGLTREAQSLLAGYLGGHGVAARMFAPPVTAAETTVQADSQTVPLVYRSGVCGHLHFTAGHCPAGRGQVVVSTSLALLLHCHLGQRIAVPTWKQLVITGVYRITPAVSEASYWFDAGSRYFRYENESGPNPPPNPYDAMFTPLGTLAGVPPSVQGTDYVDFSLIPGQLNGADLPGWRRPCRTWCWTRS